MRRLSATLIVAVALSTTTGLAHARGCALQVTQLRQEEQLDRQPTSDSVPQAKSYDELMFAADMALAEAWNADGNEEECLAAARRARQELAHPAD
jgi:hypothetical protein